MNKTLTKPGRRLGGPAMTKLPASRRAMAAVNRPLDADLLRKIDAWWRAANYLSVGQTYLYDNPNQLVQVKRWSADPATNTNAALLLEVDFKLDAFGNCLEEDLPTYSPGTPALSVQRFAYDAWNPAKPAPVGWRPPPDSAI